LRQKLAFFLLGLAAGLVVMHFVQGESLEKLYWEKEALKVELYEATERLKIMESEHETLLPALVKEIKLEIDTGEDSFVEPALRRNIYDLVKGLIGQEVLALPYPLLYNLIEDRTVEVDDNKYHLEVEAVIVSERLVYYIKATKVSED